jgi:peptidoglycan/xylan/chitin deacetylase (PgdA/CDA1 family)
MILNNIYDFFTEKCVRKISCPSAPKNAIYLTFDDGPTPEHTDQVLEILKKHQIKATFFLIATKIIKHPELALKIKIDGHAIGNHSYDHNPTTYFKSKNELSNWITQADSVITQNLNTSSVGFRSPIGIKTPILMNVLKNLKSPLVLWNVRFYDTIIGLTSKMVLNKMNQIKPGSIILLHDSHRPNKQIEFKSALEILISECKKRQFEFCLLSKDNIAQSSGIKL